MKMYTTDCMEELAKAIMQGRVRIVSRDYPHSTTYKIEVESEIQVPIEYEEA